MDKYRSERMRVYVYAEIRLKKIKPRDQTDRRFRYVKIRSNDIPPSTLVSKL